MTPLLIGLIVLGSAFAVTAAATPVIRALALSAGWLDMPDGGRKRHDRPVPSLGGLSVAFGIAGGLVALLLASSFFGQSVMLPGVMFWVGAILILLVGIADDIWGVGFKRKFCAQVGVAYLLLFAGFRVDVSVFPFVGEDPYHQALISIPLTIFWIVGVINAVNLLDGLDGLAAGVVLIAISVLALIYGLHYQVWLTLTGLAICGALAAFLLYNRRPASIFMGDSGSLLLGYLLAMFALTGRGHAETSIALLVPIMVVGLPLTDTLLAIVRRARARRSVFAPDFDHIHHRLMDRMGERAAVLLLYGWALVFGVAAAWMSVLPPAEAVAIVVVVAVLLTLALIRIGYHRVETVSEPAEVTTTIPDTASSIASTGDGWSRRIESEPALEVAESARDTISGDGDGLPSEVVITTSGGG